MSTLTLNKGDRVFWLSVGWVGTVQSSPINGHVTVKWDDHPNSYYSNPSIHHLEKINMSEYLNKGDRVRYIGTTTDYIGKTGEVLPGATPGSDLPVRWDGKQNTSYVMRENLEKIMKIDTAKSLEVTGGTNTSDMTFITMTSEGHILVSPVSKSGLGSGSAWIMFDTNGKFVRSESGNGKALTLRNKPDLPYEWVEEVAVPGFGYQKLRLTKLGDKLTAVKLA